MAQIRRSGPAVFSRAAAKTATVCDKSSRSVDEIAADKALLDGVNSDIWAALFDGQFRLAVKCRRCGRWLTGPAKRNGIGDHCAARAVQ